MSNFAGGKTKRPDTSSSSKHISIDAMGRRVWDKQVFEQIEQPVGKIQKLVAAPTEALKPRESAHDIIQAKVNERRIVTNNSGKHQQGGFFCEVCDCLLRDSVAYMDHINGRSHNRMLGMSMQVERVSLERVIAKLKQARGPYPISEEETGTN